MPPNNIQKADRNFHPSDLQATQEADNVIILQRGEMEGKYIDVRKNRFDGTLGQIPVMFDRVYGQHLEVRGGRYNNLREIIRPLLYQWRHC